MFVCCTERRGVVHVNVCHSCALPALARPPPHVVFVSVPDPKKWRHWVLKSFKGKGQVECKTYFSKNPRVCETPRISRNGQGFLSTQRGGCSFKARGGCLHCVSETLSKGVPKQLIPRWAINHLRTTSSENGVVCRISSRAIFFLKAFSFLLKT